MSESEHNQFDYKKYLERVRNDPDNFPVSYALCRLFRGDPHPALVHGALLKKAVATEERVDDWFPIKMENKCDDWFECSPQFLKEYLNCPIQQINRAIKKLVKLGLISTRQQDGNCWFSVSKEGIEKYYFKN